MAGFGEYSHYRDAELALHQRIMGSQQQQQQQQQQQRRYEFPSHSAEYGEYVLEENPEDESLRRYAGTGVGLASLLVEHLLSHPFVVLRRQCQVHRNARKYHLVPLTLVPAAYRLHARQGLTTLFKGIGSVCTIKGCTLALEDCLSKALRWPKDIAQCDSPLPFVQHLLLKSISLAVATPFYCASLVETVQSDIASEKPGFLDVFKDGASRVFAGGSGGGRMLPLWKVALPTVCVGLAKYLFAIGFKSLAARAIRFRRRHIEELLGKSSKDDSQSRDDDVELSASMVSSLCADVLFFPAETIIHRLYLQGTRTIIDDLDTGSAVLPVLTGYEGFVDCFETVVAHEGFVGLYKGLGALALQFAVHVAVVNLTKWAVLAVTDLLKPPQPKPALTASSSQQSLYSQQSQIRYLIN